MTYATLAEVKQHAIFKQQMQDQLDDPEIQRLIDRAARQLTRELERSFEDETNVDVLFDLNVANIYLVDTLFITSRPDAAHLAMSGIKSEKKGEYTVTFSDAQAKQYSAASDEYDSIIESLKVAPSSSVVSPVFRVGKRRRGVDPCD